MALNTNIPYYKIFLNGNKYLHHTSPRQFPTYPTCRNCRKMSEKSEDVGKCRKMSEMCRKSPGNVGVKSGGTFIARWLVVAGPRKFLLVIFRIFIFGLWIENSYMKKGMKAKSQIIEVLL